MKIGIVGKYTDLTESYKSLGEGMVHGAIAEEYRLEPVYLDSEKLQKDPAKELVGVDGVLVPGGFGEEEQKGKYRPFASLEKTMFHFRDLSWNATGCR